MRLHRCFVGGIAIPVLAALLQAELWSELRPLGLFFFSPAVFAAGWLGGLPTVLTATAVSSVLAS